jgi:hypothetical protein
MVLLPCNARSLGALKYHVISRQAFALKAKLCGSFATPASTFLGDEATLNTDDLMRLGGSPGLRRGPP